MDRRLTDLQAALSGVGSAPLQGRPLRTDLEQLLARLLPLCPGYGITRLADLTGLDRISLPVAQAIRPAALSEVTSLGRGLAQAEAAIGAIMEALERVVSETITPDRLFLATADDLEVAPTAFQNYVRSEHRDGWRHIRIPWMDALDVLSGSSHPVPFELVHTCYTDPPPIGDGVFQRTTTGLACHSSALQAFLHGLLECIERDALARAFVTHGFFERMRLPWPTLSDLEMRKLLDIASSNGLSVALWYVPSPAEVPVVWCQVIEAGRGEPILALPTEGYAAGASLEVATTNALLEAFATRAAAISGSRDDQTRQHYRASRDALVAQARELVAAEAPSTSTEAILTSRADDIGSLVRVVDAAGLGPVLAVPVGSDRQNGVHCIRTILAAAQPFAVVR